MYGDGEIMISNGVGVSFLEISMKPYSFLFPIADIILMMQFSYLFYHKRCESQGKRELVESQAKEERKDFP